MASLHSSIRIPQHEHETQPHLVLVALAAAFGHARPFCALAARIVKLRPIIVTLLTTALFYDRVADELARNFEAGDQEPRARLRVVALPSQKESAFDLDALFVGFAAAYPDLIAARPLTCAKTGTVFLAARRPDVIVIDVLANKVLATIRTHGAGAVRVYVYIACSASSYHQHCGVASPNQNGDVCALIHQETVRTGKTAVDVALDVLYTTTKGEVSRIPGLMGMFDYEKHPQKSLMDQRLVALLRIGAIEVTDGCDGMLIATAHAFETTETLGSLSQYYAGEVCAIGPLLPTASGASALEKSKSKDTDQIEDFLARVIQSHGPQSLVYISFGSHFWSAEPDKIWAFLDVMMERKRPFILAHASPFATIPDAVQEKVRQYELGLLSPWVPQQYILTHPAVGWFVTHCGFNGLLESIHAGVPLICWPFEADQPANALHAVVNLGIAYELFEVRSGPHGLKPVFRTGVAPTGTRDAVMAEAHRVLELAFGADGAKKREKVQVLSERFAKAWDDTEEGVARIALEQFLDKI